MNSNATVALFDLTGQVAVITGGAGLVGREHAAPIASSGGTVILADVSAEPAEEAARAHSEKARFRAAARKP